MLIAVLKYEGEKCVLGEGHENHLMILMWVGIIPFKEVTELAQLKWFGHVRMGDERCSKMAWDTRTWGMKGCRRYWRKDKLNSKSYSSRLQKILVEVGTEQEEIAQDC